jgi:hypothetical protein
MIQDAFERGWAELVSKRRELAADEELKTAVRNAMHSAAQSRPQHEGLFMSPLPDPPADFDLYRAALSAAKAFSGADLRRAASHETAALIEWLKGGRPIGPGERSILVALLEGDYCLAGRAGLRADSRLAYRELIAEAKAMRANLRDAGSASYEAEEVAAIWASQDPRARGHAVSTIRRDMQKASRRL